jgi:hypothetical protein
VSSSLSAVKELETLGLRADAEELRLERPSRRVPPKRVPRLPSPQSRSSPPTEEAGVLGMFFRVVSLSLPSEGSSKSFSNSSSGLTRDSSSFWGVGGVMSEMGLGGRVLETLIVSAPSPKKSSSSSSLSRNLSRLAAPDRTLDMDMDESLLSSLMMGGSIVPLNGLTGLASDPPLT